jgi:hypothetical protein
VTPRTVTIRIEGKRPLTTNAERKMIPQARAHAVKLLRVEAAWRARELRAPRLDACAIYVTPHHLDNRSPQDAGACAPAAKAIVDGLQDAGVLDDDSPEYVHSITYSAPVVDGWDGIEVKLIEIRNASSKKKKR